MRQIRDNCHLSKMFTVLLPLFFFWPISVSAQKGNDLCDPDLIKHTYSSSNPHRYSPRGDPPDRCEGIYVLQVANTPLFVASFTEFFEKYNTKADKDLIVEWSAPTSNNSIHIRSYGIKPKLYYRMDTKRKTKEKSYRWSTTTLADLGINYGDIGVIGWTQMLVGARAEEVYIPLRISQSRKQNPSKMYQVVLFPGRDLNEVFISLAKVRKDGKFGKFIKESEALGYGFYPAKRGIAFELSDLKEPGIYYVEIGATLRSGGTTAFELYFYHHG